MLEENPKWYFTSPVLEPSMIPFSSKAENKSSGSFPSTLTNKFNLPLCAMPKHI